RHRSFPSWTWRSNRTKVTRCRHSFRGVGSATLIQRRTNMPFSWLWAKVRQRRWLSPELQHAGMIFRLERYGVRCGRVLAFGQCQQRPWQWESFILLQDCGHHRSLRQWMTEHAKVRWTAERKQRWRLLRELGAFIRRLHQAHCYLGLDFD